MPKPLPISARTTGRRSRRSVRALLSFADKWVSLPDECVMHGLRKTAARMLAEAGCSAPQIASVTGHRSLKEIERYIRDADQKKLSTAAIHLLEQNRNRIECQTYPPKSTKQGRGALKLLLNSGRTL